MKKIQKSKLNQSLYNGSYFRRISTKARHKMQLNAYNDIYTKLLQREPFVDFETEVLPNLSENYAYIFKNYMIEPNGEYQYDIAGKLGYGEHAGTICRAIEDIFCRIDDIIRRKKEIKEYIESYGGKEVFEDLTLCLSQKDWEYLNDLQLSINPTAYGKFHEKYPTLGATQTKERLEEKLKSIIKRKADCEEFIQNNGGEDFLVNEFGMTLSDDHFYILTHFMMDYHYINDTQVSLDLGVSPNHVLYVKKSILEKLKIYNERKTQINSLIEQAGGAQKVLNEFYLNLNDIDKTIFEERVLAYYQTSSTELSKRLMVSKTFVCDQECRMIKRLEDMASEKSFK